MTCVFAWLHLDLNQGSKNVNSFHWTKFDMSCCIQKLKKYSRYGLSSFIELHHHQKEEKMRHAHSVQRLWDVVFKKSCTFYVLLLFRQYPNLTEWRFGFYPYHSFLSPIQKVMFYYTNRVLSNDSKLNLTLGSWNNSIFQIIFEYVS